MSAKFKAFKYTIQNSKTGFSRTVLVVALAQDLAEEELKVWLDEGDSAYFHHVYDEVYIRRGGIFGE